MQRLTIMTACALALGFTAYAFDAHAQTPAACDRHEATIYFAPDSNALNEYGDYAVHRMADTARACSIKSIEVETSAGVDRAKAVVMALRGQGIRAVIVPAAALAPTGDTMLARAITLRLPAEGNGVS